VAVALEVVGDRVQPVFRVLPVQEVVVAGRIIP
jgi:hypothetical protein